MDRGTGILCHISSLPGKYGIGSFGKEAYQFARLLKNCGVKYWQVLPLVQTGFGDSPYQSVCCNSGNPYFIDLESLGRMGLLTKKELSSLRRRYRGKKLDYSEIYEERYATLRLAFSRFRLDEEKFSAFVKEGKFEDYALFMTAKTVFGGAFCDWAKDLRRHEAKALEMLRSEHREEYLFWHFLQFIFWRQWEKLKRFCNQHGISIIGDLSLYVAYDSSDVWAHPELFKLDEERRPEKVAGVPPDYFSDRGQLWGNPVYDWNVHEKSGFSWWRARLESALKTYDYVRLDHFRGFDRYYEIPFGADSAAKGEWKEGPKDKLFQNFKGKNRIIAEDLGIIDERVNELMARTGFPGMKVLLFAFDGNPDNPHLPHLYQKNCVCYTGTHDNDTVVGYFKSLGSEEFILCRSRVAGELKKMGISVPLDSDPQNFARAFIEMALKSEATLAMIPVQDLIGADNSCRMNWPGTQSGNWQFRLNQFPSVRARGRLKNKIKKYRR